MGQALTLNRASLVHLAPELWGERVVEALSGKSPPATIPREHLIFPQPARLVVVEEATAPSWSELEGARVLVDARPDEAARWPSLGQVAFAFFGAMAVTLALASLVPMGRGVLRSAMASLPPAPAAMPAALLLELPLEPDNDRFLDAAATIEPMEAAETVTIKLVEEEKAAASLIEVPLAESLAIEPSADEAPAVEAPRELRVARAPLAERRDNEERSELEGRSDPAPASSRGGLRRGAVDESAGVHAQGDTRARVGGGSLVFEREALRLPQSLSRGQVAIGLRRVAPMVSNCVTDAPRTTSVALTIEGASGRVTAARLSGPLAGTSEGRCVERALRQARFSRFADPAVALASYPLVLR
jgi:hypothetical protein